MTANQNRLLEMKVLHAINGNTWTEEAMTLSQLQFFTKGTEITAYDRPKQSMVTAGFYRREGAGTIVMLYHTKDTILVAHSELDPSVVRIMISNTALIFG